MTIILCALVAMLVLGRGRRRSPRRKREGPAAELYGRRLRAGPKG